MHNRAAGIIGTGKISLATLREHYPSETALELGAKYVDLDALLKHSDIISLHWVLSH